MGGYGPQAADDLSDGGSSDVEPEGDEALPEVNVNERRTRRGVYAVLKESDDEDADEEEEEQNVADNFYKKFTNQGPAYFGDLDETDGALLEYEREAEEEGAYWPPF